MKTNKTNGPQNKMKANERVLGREGEREGGTMVDRSHNCGVVFSKCEGWFFVFLLLFVRSRSSLATSLGKKEKGEENV